MMDNHPSVTADRRAAHEATDDALNDLSGLLVGLDLLIQHHVPDSAEPSRNALNVLIDQARKRLAEVTTDLRDTEWRSIGGKTPEK